MKGQSGPKTNGLNKSRSYISPVEINWAILLEVPPFIFFKSIFQQFPPPLSAPALPCPPQRDSTLRLTTSLALPPRLAPAESLLPGFVQLLLFSPTPLAANLCVLVPPPSPSIEPPPNEDLCPDGEAVVSAPSDRIQTTSRPHGGCFLSPLLPQDESVRGFVGFPKLRLAVLSLLRVYGGMAARWRNATPSR